VEPRSPRMEAVAGGGSMSLRMCEGQWAVISSEQPVAWFNSHAEALEAIATAQRKNA
jgi:hypothetical protein